MNALVPVQPAAAPQSYGLVPATMSEAMQLANMMAGAKLVPAALQKSPADCLMVIQQAVRWQMDPFAVAQECSVIQGKLMHSGKLVAAVINARGNLAERLSFTYEGDGDSRMVTVSGRAQGEAEARTVAVRLRDARTANKVWQTQPDQQLMYHGSRVWARRHAPELMLGVWSPEEFDELPAHAKRPPAPAANVMLPLHDAETGEVLDSPPPHRTTEAVTAAPSSLSGEDESERIARIDQELAWAAEKGIEALQEAWKPLAPSDKAALKAALDRRHKPAAAKADEEAGR